jgi:hypothetical protein
MDEKVVALSERKKPRVHYRALAKKFNRPELTRQIEPVSAREKRLQPDLGPNMIWYTSRYSGPGPTYKEFPLGRMRDLGLTPELLVYRVLRDLYGTPDVITVAIPKDALTKRRGSEPIKGAFPWEWSFMLKGSSDAFIEVRKEPGTQEPYASVWVPKLLDVSSSSLEEVQTDVDLFIKELRNTLKSSKHLVNPKEIKATSIAFGPLNVYGDMLAAGDEQMAVVDRLGKRYKNSVGKDRDRAGRITSSLGSFYLAAAVNYLLALEAFVNLLSVVLRKEEFQGKEFDRATTKADFELRVLSLSLYCVGFSRAPFPPSSSLFNQLRRLRDFRNNLLHGNLSMDDHVSYVVHEDLFILHWWPGMDRSDGQTPFEELPLARQLFGDAHAKAVRKVVEQIVDGITDAMEPEFRAWVNIWRNAMLIPAKFRQGRWTPDLNPTDAYVPKPKGAK